MTPQPTHDDRRQTGQSAEDAAKDYLSKLGLHLLERNVRYRVGEIDLIFTQGKYLVFVEVRSSKSTSTRLPLESIAAKKQARLKRAAEVFMLQRRFSQLQPRFDVVIVTADPMESGCLKFEHLEAAF